MCLMVGAISPLYLHVSPYISLEACCMCLMVGALQPDPDPYPYPYP